MIDISSLKARVAVFSSLGTVALLVTFFLMIFGVFAQNLDLSGPWWREVATILTIWLVYLNVGDLAVHSEHITVQYFYDRFPNIIQRVVSLLLSLLNLFTVGLVLIAGIIGIEQVQGSVTPITQLPTTLLYLPIVVGMALLTFVYFSDLYQQLLGEENL